MVPEFYATNMVTNVKITIFSILKGFEIHSRIPKPFAILSLAIPYFTFTFILA